MNEFNTCRLCGNGESSSQALFKYGVRHYVHAECGLKKWGASLFDRLPAHQLGELPYRIMKRAGLLPELERRLRELEES